MSLALRPPCDVVAAASKQARATTQNAGPWILGATILGSSMVFIDATSVNVALPAIQTSLQTTLATTQWIIEAYSLFLSALILVGGSLGDDFGRKRMFLIGVVAFAAASAFCGLSQTANQLIAARSIQGIASALLTPGSLSILGASFSQAQRGKAIGLWSSFTAITSAGGPVLGGFIVQHFSWRWIFFVNIPLALITFVVAILFIPESRNEQAHGVDWIGGILATVGLGGIVYALINVGVSGWTASNIAWGCLGILFLVAFVIAEGRVPSPMMPLDMFANRNFSVINLQTLLLYAAIGVVTFFLPFNLILIQHYSPTAAGATLLPFSILVFALSSWVGSLVGKIGAKPLLLTGSLLSALAFLGLAIPSIGGSYWTTYFPGMVALGLGMSLVISPLTTTVMSSVDGSRFGIASGVNNAVARTAGLLAIAVATIAVVSAYDRSLERRVAQISMPPAVRAAVLSQRTHLAAAQAPAAATPEVRAQIQRAISLATVDGFRLAMILSAALALAAGLSSLLLTSDKRTPASAPESRSP